jgi:hypothetical protein
MYERVDQILRISGIEQEFINIALTEKGIDPTSATAKRLERLANYSVLAMRANIARDLTGMDHRDFCARLADSPLLQWFLQIGEIDTIKQAHERIIGERQVANEDKILSLYDDSVNVIVRGKAGAEARIGIFKNVFMGRPAPAKGFAHRELAVGWAVLTHNLWVAARLAETEKKRLKQAA